MAKKRMERGIVQAAKLPPTLPTPYFKNGLAQITMKDYLRAFACPVTKGSGSIKSGRNGVGLMHLCLRGGLESISDMCVDGEGTAAAGFGENCPATNDFKPATDPATNTL